MRITKIISVTQIKKKMRIGIPNIFYSLALIFTLGFIFLWNYLFFSSSHILDGMNKLLIFFVLIALLFSVMASYFLSKIFKIIYIYNHKITILSLLPFKKASICFDEISSLKWVFEVYFTQKTTTRELYIYTHNRKKPVIIRCSQLENFNQIVNAIPNTDTKEKNKVYKEHAKQNKFINLFMFIGTFAFLFFINSPFDSLNLVTDCLFRNICYNKGYIVFYLVISLVGILIGIGSLLRYIKQRNLLKSCEY